MIFINNLHHQFGSHVVIEDFNLKIDTGKIISFIGRSGCGKSTLLNIIGGFLKPTNGQVFIEDIEKNAPSSDCLMLFQHNNLLPWKNINDNIRLGLKHQISNNQINEYLKMVDLDSKGTYFPESMSGGMKQRAALCKAQIHEPKVILLDEPLGALDAFTRYKLQDQLLQLKQHTSATIVLVTHDIEEALYLSDEIVLLNDGCNIIKQYSVEERHPRNRNSQGILKLRTEIMNDFSINHPTKEPEYYL